jgi:hypothetical protein
MSENASSIVVVAKGIHDGSVQEEERTIVTPFCAEAKCFVDFFVSILTQ